MLSLGPLTCSTTENVSQGDDPIWVGLGVAWHLVENFGYRRSRGLLLIKVSDISATIGASEISDTTHRLKTSSNSSSVY